MDAEHEALTTLKAALLPLPDSARRKEGWKYTVDTDASEAHVGSHLMQEQEKRDVLPVAYWS